MRLIDGDALSVNLDGMMAVSPTGYIHGDTIADMIGDAPTIDTVRKGHWISIHPLQDNDSGAYMCSVCNTGDWDIKPTDKYCKFCGAKMEEGD